MFSKGFKNVFNWSVTSVCQKSNQTIPCGFKYKGVNKVASIDHFDLDVFQIPNINQKGKQILESNHPVIDGRLLKLNNVNK